jgi:hypothetical protein
LRDLPAPRACQRAGVAKSHDPSDRPKMIKRQDYGRANLALFRRRILVADCSCLCPSDRQAGKQDGQQPTSGRQSHHETTARPRSEAPA